MDRLVAPQHGYALVGQVFERLTVLAPAGRTGYNDARYLCVCACGNFCRVGHKNMKGGKIRSCGCLAQETRRENGRKTKRGPAACKPKTYATDLFSVW